jgi:hypothetical protein
MKSFSRSRHFRLLLAGLFFSVVVSALYALPIGTISNPTTAPCGTNYYGGSKATCTMVTVSCPNVADTQAIYGYYAPSGTTLGLVAFVNGASDTTPGGANYLKKYLAYGFAIEQVVFPTGWEMTGETPNLKNASCRLATLLSYLQQQDPSLPFAAQAGSAAAGGVGYALAWYGFAPQVVELSSGPVFSDIELGCEVPHAAAETVIPTNGVSWTDQMFYSENTVNSMEAWTGNNTCAGKKNTSQISDADWKAMSIVSPRAQTSFPSTVISGWVCNNAINNSASQAYVWFAQLTTPWSLTAMTNCTGTENIDDATTPQGLTGLAAVTADVEANLHF